MKSKFFKFSEFSAVALTVAVMAVVLSCNDKEKVSYSELATLSVIPSVNDIVFDADGKTATVAGATIATPLSFIVETNQSQWEVTNNPSWIIINRRVGVQQFNMTVQPAGFTPPEPAEITVKAGDATPFTIRVRQLGLTPALLVTPEYRDVIFSFDGIPFKPAAFFVTTNASEPWDAVLSDESWLTLTKEGNMFSLTAAENTGYEPFADVIVTVTAGEAPPVYITVIQEQVPYEVNNNDIIQLLSRLDLTKPGLEEVNAASSTPQLAIRKLLDYYRARTSVKHPIDRALKNDVFGKGNYANANAITVANYAMAHIFQGHGSYPYHNYGPNIDWGYNPTPDMEWVWQLHRLVFMNNMSSTYWHTGDEQYTRKWAYLLDDWVRKNPRDNAHAYAWRSIEAGIRGDYWTTVFQRFIDSPYFTPDVLVTFLNSCYEHTTFLMTQYTSGSNWALFEADGMAALALLFPEFKNSEVWITESAGRLNLEIGKQVNTDGYQRELSAEYHIGCIGNFNGTLDRAYMNGLDHLFPESYRTIIEKMCEAVMTMGFPDGTKSMFGDSDKSNSGYLWTYLKTWAERYNRPDFLYVSTEGMEGVKPVETAFAYPVSGLYSMRSGWDKNAIFLALKCGADGGMHSQPDNGTFELYAGGRTLMPDAGFYVYDGDPTNRNWFRQTKVHQTLTLNEGNSRYAPKHLFWQTGENLDVLVVENASYTNLTHRRAVFFVDKSYFVIVDEGYGAGTGNVDIHFQLIQGTANFDYPNLTARTAFTSGWNVLVKNVISDGATMAEEEGQVSYSYLQKQSRPAFRYRVSKTTAEGKRFVTIVAPYNGTDPPSINVELIGAPAIGSNKIDLRVTGNGSSKEIGYNF